MTPQDIQELAAILVAEHGRQALQIARDRRDQHDRERNATAYRLWEAITAEVARRLGEPVAAEAGED
jgi:hypothetical protein